MNEQPKQVDAVAVLGSGIKIFSITNKSTGKTSINIKPTLDAKYRAIAGAEIFRLGLARNIIFTGGQTQGKEYPSEASVMADFISRKYQDKSGAFSIIPDEAVVLEEKSMDTSTNLENVEQLKLKYGWKNVVYLTNRYHQKRLKKLLQTLEIDGLQTSAENWLIQRNPTFRNIVWNYYNSSEMLIKLGLEKVSQTVMLFDPKAQLIRKIASKIRS